MTEYPVPQVGNDASDGEDDTEDRDCEKMIILMCYAVDNTNKTVGEVEEVENNRTMIIE